MLSLFQRKRVQATSIPSPPAAAEPAKNSIQPQSAASLLATPRRQRLLEHIWQHTSLSRKQFATLYRAPLERYAALVQAFPASEAHHHAYPGGMLDHGLEIVAYALKLRQSHLLPIGASPEDQAAQTEAWTAATAYAALLHDIGKIAVDLHVEHDGGKVWHPWHGPLDRPYRFRYRVDREYRLHGAATGLLYTRVLDSAILDWLSDYPDLWRALLYVLAGQYEHAGVLGDLVAKADKASVAQALGGDPAKAMAAPRHALQRKLLEGLRHLLREELKINQPQASDAWLTEDALWLVSKTVSDKLRAHLLSQGISGIPANNTAIFNVLQDHGMLLPTADGKAIWRATITSDSGWSHAFTLLKISPALVWESSERPKPFVGSIAVDAQSPAGNAESPATNAAPGTSFDDVDPDTALHASPANSLAPASVTTVPEFDVMDDLLSMIDAKAEDAPVPQTAMQPGNDPVPAAPPAPVSRPADTPAIPSPTSAPAPAAALGDPQRIAPGDTATPHSAEDFISWLRDSIQARKLIVNDARALVHTVSDTAYLVSPGIFQRYAQERPQVAAWAKQDNLPEWRWVQKHFEKLQLHRKQPSGLNIWTCEVTGPRKSRRLHGYLLNEASRLFSDRPPNNPYLSVIDRDPQNLG